MWSTPIVLVGALLVFALAHHLLRLKFPKNTETLIDAIDQLLPQTQCAQCGYPGCRPYANAIVEGEALNLCPPGGAEVHQQLVSLMGEDRAGQVPEQSAPVVALIDESLCIGCALCLPPCPVDAIVGAPNKMHTVIEAQCTGCELCIPACPVDCISLAPAGIVNVTPRAVRQLNEAPARACIQCGLCNPVCPVELPAQELLHAVQTNQTERAAAQGLTECIECGLCDRACPSDINMANILGKAKAQWQTAELEQAQRIEFKNRFAAHQTRQQQQAAAAEDKRKKRLMRSANWS